MPRRKQKRSEDSYIIHNILPAFADYGYPVAGDSEHLKIKGDIRIRMGSSYKEPDVVFYADGVPVLLVEGAREGESKEKKEEQVQSYIRNFPVNKYSRDGRPPKYAAVTIGQKIFFYKYEWDTNEYGAIIDRLEPMASIPTYNELRRWYGLELERKPAISPESFKDIFYQIISAFDIEDKKEITPEVVLQAVRLVFEFLKDQTNYTTRTPYTDLDGYPDRQRMTRSILGQYDWGQLGSDIAYQFRWEILRSFQGSEHLNQYITPREVIIFMTQLVGIRPADKVLDFECGSGGFLAAAAQAGVPLSNIRGIDIADLPYYVSRLFLALNFNIQGNEITEDNPPIYNDNGLYFWGDDWDVVIGNPAGGNEYTLDDLEKVYEGGLQEDLDSNGRRDPTWEYNFSIQQAVRSAKVGGRIGLVLPEGFFSNSSADFLRKYVAKHCKVKAIISLPRGIFYKGTTTRQVRAGRQVAQMKMSILYAEKIKGVVPGEPLDSESTALNYPVFLAAIQKSETPDPEWLQKSLERVLEDYKDWERGGAFSTKNEPINFREPKSIRKFPLKQLTILTKEKKRTSKTKMRKPPSKEETIIPENLKDIF